MKPKQSLMLGLLLLVPVLVFLLLKGFGTNHYDLKYYYPEMDDEGNAIVQKEDTTFRKIADFHLTSQSGKPVSQKDLQNKVFVANFFFANCQGICKKMTSQMTRVQEKFKNNPDVKLVSYTVDPARDSVEALQEYASQYGADPDKWYFLTGPKKEIYDLAINSYLLPAQENNDGTVDFVHSEKFLLVDKDKHVRGIYDGTSQKDVDRLLTEIDVLLSTYKQNEK
jgi:protein SCO1/2